MDEDRDGGDINTHAIDIQELYNMNEIKQTWLRRLEQRIKKLEDQNKMLKEGHEELIKGLEKRIKYLEED